jgi:hypothetical protein
MNSNPTRLLRHLITGSLLLILLAIALTPSPALAQRDDPENIPPPETSQLPEPSRQSWTAPATWNTQCEGIDAGL